jgi:hypothetical protein
VQWSVTDTKLKQATLRFEEARVCAKSPAASCDAMIAGAGSAAAVSTSTDASTPACDHCTAFSYIETASHQVCRFSVRTGRRMVSRMLRIVVCNAVAPAG